MTQHQITIPQQATQLLSKLENFNVHSSATELELFLTDVVYICNTLNQVTDQVNYCHHIDYWNRQQIVDAITKRVMRKILDA
jgi:hypothetical protein